MEEIININGYTCVCADTCITILDSSNVPDNDIPAFVKILRTKIDKNPKLKNRYKRSEKSWVKEWVAHNRLYRMKLFVVHTKDVDLDEKEPLHRLIAYEFFGRKLRNTF